MLEASGPFDAILTIAALQSGQQRLLVVAVGRDVLGRVEPQASELRDDVTILVLRAGA
jgi:hypothetical protein